MEEVVLTPEDIRRLMCGPCKMTYDAYTKTAQIWMQELHCTDMSGAIEVAQRVASKDVLTIETFSGATPDIIYCFIEPNHDWVAIDKRTYGRRELPIRDEEKN